MSEEREHPVLVSQGLDDEIRELSDTQNYLETNLGCIPEGSCDYRLAQAQLEGVRERLEELGVHHEVVLYEEEKDPLDFQGAGVAQIIASLHYLRELAAEGLKIEDAGRWQLIQERRGAKR